MHQLSPWTVWTLRWVHPRGQGAGVLPEKAAQEEGKGCWFVDQFFVIQTLLTAAQVGAPYSCCATVCYSSRLLTCGWQARHQFLTLLVTYAW